MLSPIPKNLFGIHYFFDNEQENPVLRVGFKELSLMAFYRSMANFNFYFFALKSAVFFVFVFLLCLTSKKQKNIPEFFIQIYSSINIM